MTRLAPVIFNGRYELQRRLGRGGVAEVYLARDQMLDRAVAVKVLFPALATDAGFVERFRREAQSAAGLNHPNIVTAYDWGEANGSYFIVMEYVEGESLAELIQHEGRLPADRAAEIAADIASALGFAHRNGGVIHRDVKPGNVLITREGDVKVADFAIAGAVSDTPGQARGADVGPRSDVYSLGCVLYEMITGRPPFPGESTVSIASEAVREAPVVPRRIDPAIPETLEAIILKCLAKNPASRYPSAQDMRSDLRRYLEGARISAKAGLAPPIDPDATEVMAPPDDPDATEVMAPTGPVERITVRPTRRPDEDHGGHGDDDHHDGRRSEEPPRSFAVLIVLVVLLLVLGGLLLLVTRGRGGGADGGTRDAAEVTVPRVIDMPQADAVAALGAANLVPKVETAANDTVPAGTVVDQNPGASESVAAGSEIIITVSSGPGTTPIPDVKGKTLDEALRTLSDLDFVPSPKEVESTTVAEGLVVDTNPPAGTPATHGATVEIQVSVGSNTAAVPDVTNQPEAQARAALEGAGFTVTTVQQPSDAVPPGTVIGTNPGPGAMATKGSMITMIVSGSQMGTVPDVVGRDEGDARHELESAGFQVTTVEQPVDRRRWDGRVVGQNPPGGTPSPAGTVVTIVVGRAQGFG